MINETPGKWKKGPAVVLCLRCKHYMEYHAFGQPAGKKATVTCAYCVMHNGGECCVRHATDEEIREKRALPIPELSEEERAFELRKQGTSYEGPKCYYGWTCELCGNDPKAPCLSNVCYRQLKKEVVYNTHEAYAEWADKQPRDGSSQSYGKYLEYLKHEEAKKNSAIMGASSFHEES